MIHVGYPGEDEEFDIVKRTTARQHADLSHVLEADRILEMQALIRDVPVADHVVRYALKLVRATRKPDRGQTDERPDFMQKYLAWGAGPRASQALILAGKAHAVLDGRTHVTPEDVQQVVHPVLRHRLIPNFNAEADGIRSDDLIDLLLEKIKPESGAGSKSHEMDAVVH